MQHRLRPPSVSNDGSGFVACGLWDAGVRRLAVQSRGLVCTRISPRVWTIRCPALAAAAPVLSLAYDDPMSTNEGDGEPSHSVSVIIPVYKGAATLPSVVAELSSLTVPRFTASGAPFRIAEVLLVHDHGPDDSDAVIRSLAGTYSFVRPVWLSRNFGQHAATLAGMASSASEWIVTLDEDGQHDPACIADMLDAALRDRAAVVYASPINSPSHGWFRNTTSWLAKIVFPATAVERIEAYVQ